ncbi:unnamed protein product [Urochloa decumbens]|uniref:Uncharacterized protein n=1 Tax=Urochloa decumbens TaxID=240449 RepID=A0ABC9BP15_9POAL
MDVAFSPTTTPNFLLSSSLDGPPRLSPAPGAMAPPPPLLLAENDVVQAATSFGEDEFQATQTQLSAEEFQALMLELDQCEPLSSEDAIQQLQALPSGENDDDAQLQAPPQFAVDDDDEILAALRCEEDTKGQEMLAAQPPPQSGAPRHDDGEPAARRRQATKQSAHKKSMKGQRELLRSWHRWIATCVLTRQFRAPEVSGGRTALRCQCLELARAEGPCPCRRRCALHQEGAPGWEWIRAARGGGGRIPPLGGVDEVVVPALWAGDGAEAVAQYARWRRGVWMPTRFYLQRAAERRKVAGFEERGDGDGDGWMSE